jgi:PrtD family type I secretion system ABC transporter
VSTQFDKLVNALGACKIALYYSLLFSFVSNLLLLVIPMYSLQVLDRVISSGSMETLLMLTLVVVFALVCLGLMQIVRSALLIRLGGWLERQLAPMLFQQAIANAAIKRNSLVNPFLQELTTIKNFITGSAMNAFLDLPWSVIFVVVLFFIHPVIGIISIIGAGLLLILAVLNEINSKPILNEASECALQGKHLADIATRNAEAIEAMGMLNNVTKHWHQKNEQALLLQADAGYKSALFSGITRVVRLLLQIAVTGIGAYYALQNQMTVGSMIAAGILMGRALAPYENAISSWKSVISARKSFARLRAGLERAQVRPAAISLPKPKGEIKVEGIVYTPAGTNKPVLKGISFALAAGEVLAVIGPSAAGKSTLAKLLTGVWQANLGVIRIDGADIYRGARHDIGAYIGYLPQDIELFAGTIKANIARMNDDANDDAVVAAAKAAHVHELILRLPAGYETEIGLDGMALSAGQRQRIALARAFYGDPKFIVLDEPNANLDSEGDAALAQALAGCHGKITTIIISHRPAVLQVVDKILVLQEGSVNKFGERNEILQAMQPHNLPLKRRDFS